jgi:hypothetical protein
MSAAHRERPGERDLEWPIGVASYVLHHIDLDRAAPPDRSDHPRHGDGRPRAIDGYSGPVDVDAVERDGEAVGVALPADFAIGDDVEPDALLLVHRQRDGVVVGLGEVVAVDPPEVAGADPHR